MLNTNLTSDCGFELEMKHKEVNLLFEHFLIILSELVDFLVLTHFEVRKKNAEKTRSGIK